MDLLLTIIPLAFGVAVLTVAWRRRTTVAPIAFLQEIEGIEPADDYQAMLKQPVGDRAMHWLQSQLKGQGGNGRALTQYRSRIAHELALAGLDRATIPEVVIVAQAFMAVVGVAVGLLLIETGAFSGSIGRLSVIGLVAGAAWYPRIYLTRKGRERSARISTDLPDLLELTSMGITAGLSVDGAIETVLADFEGPLADELRAYLEDEALGTPRKVALERVKQRTDVRGLSQLMVTLAQAEDMGMPIASVLRATSADARQRRQQEARERAAKLPVKMLLPLVFCVFPPILVIILGPAAATIQSTLGS